MAAAAGEEEVALEVRCAGCGETLEVEGGLTEFACPDCATPQALPPELMPPPPPPPPPRPRRALPLGPAGAPARVACWGCGAVLAVLRGLRHLACPLCDAEIDVDGGGRRVLAAQSGVQVISPPGAVALVAKSSRLPEEEPISQAICVGQVQVGRYNKPTPFPTHSVREESICSLRSNTRTAVHVDWAKSAPVYQSIHREESPIRLLSETVDGHNFRKKSRPSAGLRSVCVDKVRLEHPSTVSHAPWAQEGLSNHSLHSEEVHAENQSGTIRIIGIQKTRHAVSSIAEQETVEPPSQTACAEQVEAESCDNTAGWNQKRSGRTTAGDNKRKKRGLTSSREEIHLTCSKHVQPEGRNMNPIQQPARSSNENQSDPADIDRIIARLCPSGLLQKRVSLASSNDLENIDATLPPVSINHGTSQGDCFPHDRSLVNQGFSSAPEHEILEESLNGMGSPDRSCTQIPNPSVGILHKQHSQGYPSQSDQEQIGICHRKIVRHYKNTANDSMYLLNEGDYIGEQPHTGINQQVTLVAASCNTTASPPLLTATPLPVATPPSVVSRPPVQRPSPHCQSSDTPHSQAAQTAGIRSIDRSSRKHRGRGPTKLIEPRREADRPVLTPNNTDTWDVDPPCPKVASTISALLKQWHPGSTYVPANQHTNEVHQEQLILHWHQYHSDTRAIIMDEFLQRYKWAPGREAVCLKLFDRKIVRQFTGLLCDEKRRARVELAASRKPKGALDAARSKKTNLDDKDAGEELKQWHRDPAAVGCEDDDPLQWKPFPPAWLQPKWWEMLCEHWASEKVLQVSAQKRKNRYTAGSAQHTAGSRSIAMHRKLMIIENGGKPVSDIEVFNKTHKRDGGKGEFVTERAKKTMERFKRCLEEAGDIELDPHLVRAQEVGGRNRGRYYGLHGIIDKARIDAMAKSSPGCLDKETQKEMFTQDQVQEMISQAMQQLNEAWEKRFQSLEERMHGALSFEAPQHDPWPCTARPVAEEGRMSRQDASDSSHEGAYRSATDADENYVDD